MGVGLTAAAVGSVLLPEGAPSPADAVPALQNLLSKHSKPPFRG